MNIKDSARLTFKLMSSEDADLLFELDQDPDVMRFLSGGKPTSKDDINNVFLPRMAKFRNAKKGWGLWQVNIKENTQFIGWVLVRPMEFFSDHVELNNLELGWRFKKSSWGKGFATEAAKQVKSTFEKNTKITSFTATALENNQASISVMKKLGMSYIKSYLHKGSFGDENAVYYQVKNL